MPKIPFRPKTKFVFVALANIEKFLNASREYGVPEMSLFEPTDLVEGRKGTLCHVIDCLDRLGILVGVRTAVRLSILRIKRIHVSLDRN